ncbi:MAG TPA: ABC transporter permease [Thermoanaerobaculia bacterium]|nr:ABC transporter permease [Thermoanaerobaculia bacterium]
MSRPAPIPQEPASGSLRPVIEFENAAGSRLSLAGELRDIAGHDHLLSSLVLRDLTIRYKRSVLGFLWTMLNPLLMMVVLTLVFSAFFRFAIEHYEIYFLSQYLPWIFFSQTTVNSMAAMAWNGPLMKRVRIPKSIFAVAATFSGMANLLLSCVPLLALMLLTGAPIPVTILFLPVSFLILGLFTLGISLALSSLSVYFADVKETYQVAVLGLMYLAPIFYPMSIVPEQYMWIIRLNPMFYLLQICRDPIYSGRIPAAGDLMVSSICAAGALVIGWLVFRRLSAGFYAHL